jgi:hypothetical protein
LPATSFGWAPEPYNHLIDRSQDDWIIGVFADHLAALKQALFLPELRRQADAAICRYPGVHGASPICAILRVLSQRPASILRNATLMNLAKNK